MPQNTAKAHHDAASSHHNAAQAHYNTGYDSGYGSSPPSNGLYPMTAAAQLARPLFSPGPPPVTSAKKAAHTTAGKASRNAGKAHHNTAKARHNSAAKAPQNTVKAHQNIVKAPRNIVKVPRVQATHSATRKQPSPLTNNGTASGEHVGANQAKTHTNKPAKHTSSVSKAERRKMQPVAQPSQQVQSARAPKAPTTPTKRVTINPTTPPNNGKRSATSELEQEAAKKFKNLSPTARPIAERKGLIELMWSPTKGQYKPVAILSALQKNALQPPFGNVMASNTQIPNTKPAARKIKQPKKPKQAVKPKSEAKSSAPSSATSPATSSAPVERIPLPIADLPQPPLPAFARRQIREEDIPVPSIEVEEDYISQKLRKALREKFERSNDTADLTVASVGVNHAFTSDVQTAQAFVQLPTNSQPQTTYQPAHHTSTFGSAYQQVNTGNCFVAYNMSNTNSAVASDQLVPHSTDAIADAEQAAQPNLSVKSEQQAVDAVHAAVDVDADAPVLDTTPADAPVDLAPAIEMASAADTSTNYHLSPDLDTSFDLDMSLDVDMAELHPGSALARLIADPPEHSLSRKSEPYNFLFTPNERSLEVIMKEPFDSLNETERARILVPLLYGIDPREFWARATWDPAVTPRGDLVGPALACKLKSLADKAAMNPGRKQKQDAVMDMVQIARHLELKDRQVQIEAMHARRQQAMQSQAAAMRTQAANIQAAATRMHTDAARLFLQAEMLEAGQIAPFQNPTQPGDVGQTGQFNHTAQPTAPTGQFAAAFQTSETPEQMGARRQREAMMKTHRENARRVQTQQMQQEQLQRK
jgi:hypothetical protein